MTIFNLNEDFAYFSEMLYISLEVFGKKFRFCLFFDILLLEKSSVLIVTRY